MNVYPYHVNDPEFADALVDAFLEISEKNVTDSSSLNGVCCEPREGHHEDSVSDVSTSIHGTIWYSPRNFPDATPGCSVLSSSLQQIIILTNSIFCCMQK